MATDKSLADSDDDIIDLTDLVEEGSAGDVPSGDDGPVDMSFEQELEDLFGDAEPAAPTAPTAAAGDDGDLMDLAGFDVDETPDKASPATDPDDDVMDLAGFEVNASPSPAPATAAADADDDVMDLAGLDFDEAPAAPEVPAAAAGDDEAKAPAPSATAASPSQDDEVDVLPDLGSELATDDISPVAADQETAGAPAAETTPADDAMDLSDLDLSAFEPESPPAASEAPATEAGTAQTDLLETVPYAPDISDMPESLDDETTGMADLSGLPLFDEPAPAVPADEAAPASTATGEAAMTAMAVAAAAASGAAMARPTTPQATIGAIDLGALDNLIDSAKGPLPPPEPEAAPATARLDALSERIASLETATATLFDKVESLPPATDGEALADALSARLEDALSERLEAVLAGQPPMPDVAGLRSDILAEIERRVPDRASLLADLQAALAPQFESLRGNGEPAGKAETTAALDSLRESLVRLEALTQGRQTKFEDFAETMEARLAELRRALPGPDAYASTESVGDALETLRENLSRDIAANLDERLAELRRELRETLAGDVAAGLDERLALLRGELRETLDERLAELGGDLRRSLADDMAKGLDERLPGIRSELRETLADDIAASLDERLADVVDAGRQAAAGEVRSLGEALSGRLDALEKDRLDPDALADRVREALLPSLPDARTLQEADKAAARAEEAATIALSRLEDKAGHEDLDAAMDGLRAEMAAEIERAVPRAAAAVIREEIAALLKDFE